MAIIPPIKFSPGLKSAQLNWAEFFDPDTLANTGLPILPGIDFKKGMMCRHLLKASDIVKEQNAAKAAGGRSPTVLSIVCDVFTLDCNVVLDSATYIIARRIETIGEYYITLNASQNPRVKLKVAVQETLNQDTQSIAPLIINVMTSGEGRKPILSKVPLTATYAKLDAGQSETQSLVVGAYPMSMGYEVNGTHPYKWDLQPSDVADVFLDGSHALGYFLKIETFLGCLYIEENRDYALQLFDWVAVLTAGNQRESDLSMKAQSLISVALHLPQADNTMLFVPALSPSIYADSAQICLDILADREKRYEGLKAIEHTDENWQNSVKENLENSKNDDDLNRSLLERAEDDLAAISRARMAAAIAVRQQEDELKRLKVKFDIGVALWEINERDKAILALFKNIFDLLVQIPQMVTAGVEMGATMDLGSVADIVQSLWPNDLVGRPSRPLLVLDIVRDDNRARLIDLENQLWNARSEFEAELAVIPAIMDFEEYMQSLEIYENRQNEIENQIANVRAEDADYAAHNSDQPSKYQRYEQVLEERENERKARRVAQKAFRESIKKGGDSIKGIVSSAMLISQIEATADAMHRDGANILSRIRDGIDTSFQHIKPTGIDVVTGGAQVWDELAINMETAFEKGGKGKIEEVQGGREYLDGFRVLIAKSKSMSAARLALVKANSDVANAILRKKAAERSVKIYETRLKDLDKTLLQDRDLIATAFERVIDGRLSVFMAMESYRRAFAYFALLPLNDWPKLPNIAQGNVTDLKQSFSKLAGKEFEAASLKRSGLVPSRLNGQKIIIEDPATLDAMRTNPNKFSIDISPNHISFNHLRRIRITEVQIYFEGLETDKEIVVDILTSGFYRDKHNPKASDNGKPYTRFGFVSDPWHKLLKYKLKPLDTTSVADVADEYKGDYFMPTPFTQWILGVSANDDTPLDLLKVTAVIFKFYGYNSV